VASRQESRIKAQELPSKAEELKDKTFKTCILIICIIGSRATNPEQRTRTTCQELQQADTSDQRKTTVSSKEDSLLLMTNSFEDQDNREQRNYNFSTKKDDLKQRSKQPNNIVQRRSEMELHIEAPIKETAKKREEQLRMTDKLIVSANSLRERGLFLFIKRRR